MNDIIITDLINNQDYYKLVAQDLTDELTNILKTEDPVFYDAIKHNYFDLVRQRFLIEMTTRLKVSPEDAMIVLQTVNLEDYLKCSFFL